MVGVAFIFVLVVASASELATDLKKCWGIADHLERLTCYDRLANEVDLEEAGVTEAPATPQGLRSSPAPRSTPTPVSVGRCQAITKKGRQCSRNAQPGRRYCWQHP